MKKIMIVALVLQVLFTSAPFAFSASDKCVVRETKGSVVVLECTKKSRNFKLNDTVKVKSIRKTNVEGC